ncbi:integrin beta-4 [Lates japonicus]|uniref:Integrin beta n=1 Tax=Lates japonicus TaxID=270547 RepID=A0AAD3MQE3_LATJO|nr:integrin beta-4 [Lates japonicus]
MGRWLLHLLSGLGLLVVLSTYCHAEPNYCLAARAKSCSECLQAGIDCTYCSEENFNGPRCDLHKNILAHGCSATLAITAKSTMSTVKTVKIDTMKRESQVYPQLMSMSFLPGETKVMDMEVFTPDKGPLDLYILMDFSNSMADDLDNLKRMGNKLAELVEKLSDDYTIGFGKFVDKVIEPQTDMRPAKLAQPWPNSDPPFSFQNVIKLTSDVNEFTSKLQKERISGNLDAPEGGFDAILQAAVCKDQIGWRNHSTHLLVFSTESAFHYEADGANVLSGILKRNDERCHLDANGKYTEDIHQDYPSIPTLVRVLGKHNIIPIFAVTDHSYSYYEKLQAYFPIAEVGLLQEDSSNILQVMETAFKSIRSKMSIRAEDAPKAFKTEFLSAASQTVEYGAFNFTPGYIGKLMIAVSGHRIIDDKAVCQVKQDEKEGTMRVKPTTFNNGVDIRASVVCATCECEKTPIAKASKCHRNGDLVCGQCRCYDGWQGKFCNCSAGALAKDTSQCIGPGMTEPCSGRGDCLPCGNCVCYNPEKYEGAYCQYDRTSCQRFGGFLCNDRGSCIMGQCACKEGWKGSACECPKSNQTCLDSKGGVCNNRGKCVCGRCECLHSNIELTSTCEPNFQAQLGVCEGTRHCAQCKAWKTGKLKAEEDCAKCSFEVEMVDELEEREKVLDSCSFRDEEDDCTYHYTVDNTEVATEALKVKVLKKKDCPPASLLWLLPLILFLLLLLALLALCCWKYCACCKGCLQSCLALLPCCTRGRMVGFKEDEYLLRQSLLTSDHLDTPMVRTGPPKGTDVVRWKVTDNVHRGPNHPQALIKPNPKETIQFPISLRLNRLFSENLSRPESRDAEQLRKEVSDNLNEVYKQIPSVVVGGARRLDMIGGGVHTSEVIMRKRSENRGYTDENIRDSIVMGDVSSKFPDLGGFGYTGMQSSSQSQFSYSLSQGPRARTQSSDVNEALYNLDRVLQDARLSPGVPDTPSRLVFSALGPTALKVSWQEPHCEKDILGYCVLYQLLNGGDVKRINVTNPAENSVIIQDLLPNHSYLFKVKAQSQEGWGPEREGVITIESAVDPKSPLSPMPGSPFTLSTPSAPGPLVFTALSPDSLQLSWEKPRKPNGDILGYVVTCEQLHGGGDVRSFQVNGNSAETSLTVPNLTENVPYKFKVQARTTQGFGPEREGIITIESQDGGALSQYNSQSMTRREVFHMPTEVSTRTNVSHTMLNDPYFSGTDGMMMTTQHTESSGMVTRQITKEVVQRSVMGGTTVTKKMFYES